MSCARAVTCLAILALVGGSVATQPPAKDSKPPSKPDDAPANTLKLEKKPFKIALTVKGALAAEEATEISYRPHPLLPPPASQGSLTIRSVVEHGVRVKQGDLLVAFDPAKLDDVIADLEKDIKSLDASLRLAEEELPLFEKSVPVELAAAETAKKRADEELKYFLEVGRDHEEKQAEWWVKGARFMKEYAEEELRQLEKMYKRNDLTEETEKMILRRQQHWLERASFYYQSAVLERDHLLKFTLPTKEKSLRDSQVSQELLLAKAHKTLGPTLTQKQISLAKLRADRDKSSARLEKLASDRAALTVRAPTDGIVYHGRFYKGQWSGYSGQEAKLVPGGSVSPDEVFLTVVKPRPVVVHLTIDEKDVHLVKAGLEGKAKVPLHPDRRLAARVSKVAPVPAAPGKFDAQVVLELGGADADLVPGMACSVHFIPYAKRDALAVPAKSIHEEDDKYFVDVVGKKGRPEKREVTPGHTDGEHTEILAGLRPGDRVYLERPDSKTGDAKQAGTPDAEKGAAP